MVDQVYFDWNKNFVKTNCNYQAETIPLFDYDLLNDSTDYNEFYPVLDSRGRLFAVISDERLIPAFIFSQRFEYYQENQEIKAKGYGFFPEINKEGNFKINKLNKLEDNKFLKIADTIELSNNKNDWLYKLAIDNYPDLETKVNDKRQIIKATEYPVEIKKSFDR